MTDKTCYILEFSTAAPTQINYEYLLEDLVTVKQTLTQKILDIDELDLFIWDGSEVYLYLIQNGQLMAKYDVKSWVKVIFRDIVEITFNKGETITNYLSEDQIDRDTVDNMSECIEFTNAEISADFTQILIDCDCSAPVDGFETLEILILYPDLPELADNTCTDIYLPYEWTELPAGTYLEPPRMITEPDEDDRYLMPGLND